MTVYLVDQQFYDIALSYSSLDSNAQVVLLEDAVYLALKENKRFHGKTFALVDDVSRRGLDKKIPTSLHLITYDGLVQMMENEKVINFL